VIEPRIKIEYPEKNEQSLLVPRRRIIIDKPQEAAYFTVDVYPEKKPRFPSRHFGTWQFQTANLTSPEVEIFHNNYGLTALTGGAELHPSRIIDGRLKSPGLYKVYLALLAADFKKRAENFYYQIIPPGGALNLLWSWPGLHQRFPTRTEPAYLSLKRISETLRAFIAASGISRNSRVLDVGCAHKPYFPFFAPTGCAYAGIDIFDGQCVDVVWDEAGPFPFADGSFDAAISTQVLEHTANPKKVVDETYRVLKPGGKIFFSAPFAWEKHEFPEDYWRFSEGALDILFSLFAGVDIQPTGDSAQCLAELRNLYDHRRRRPGFWRDFVISLRNRLAARREHSADILRDFSMPSNYIVTGVKPAAAR
jgi:SAM-dependent methyltransferase